MDYVKLQTTHFENEYCKVEQTSALLLAMQFSYLFTYNLNCNTCHSDIMQIRSNEM
jgi:hypothetical protein